LAGWKHEAYNNFARLEEKDWKYLIRSKNSHRENGHGVKLRDRSEFDLWVNLTPRRLTERQSGQRGFPLPERYCRSQS